MTSNYAQLTDDIKIWARALGFDDVGITNTNLEHYQDGLKSWLAKGYHADMAWMADHGDMRYTPESLLPGTLRIISVRMNYLPITSEHIKTLKSPEKAYIARYALGRDYHKVIRKRLRILAKKIEMAAIERGFAAPNQRGFVDSAPVMERPLAEKAGLGWIGKNTLIIHRDAGSWFFLGELFTSLPLYVDERQSEDHCGTCTACLKVCPTDAFPEPYQLDARRCISYWTIENKGAIPEEFREPMGNRVFGCDDCQAICPWNKYAHHASEDDFKPRHQLDNISLLELFLWDEATYLKNTEGSPLRRIGYDGWLRNLAVGLGNAPSDIRTIEALKTKRATCSPLVKEHIDWAIEQQNNPQRRRKRKIKSIEA